MFAAKQLMVATDFHSRKKNTVEVIGDYKLAEWQYYFLSTFPLE